jgi:hypothetical protein
MRLIVAVLILGVAALNFWFGAPETALHFWGLIAGVLLVLSLVIDLLILGREPDAPSKAQDEAERLRSEPSE